MSPEEIKKIVETEIEGLEETPNFHGINLKKCLVQPYKVTAREPTVKDGNFKNQLEKVWIVLEENPGEPIGYKIYYDESCAEFGLMTNGLKDNQYPVILGIYGSFLDTLKAM